MASIILLEDEQRLADFIIRGLSEEGYKVTHCQNIQEISTLLSVEGLPELVILDIMLPDGSGLDLCKHLRSKYVDLPLLILTALSSTEDVVKGLHVGADDYLIKPFQFAELKARIAALLRRSTSTKQVNKQFKFGALHIDLEARSVQNGNERLDLTHTEFKLLDCLLTNKNKVVSRSQLLESVWGDTHDRRTNIVDVYVNYLRKKIDPKHSLIQTVIGMGYVIRDSHEV